MELVAVIIVVKCCVPGVLNTGWTIHHSWGGSGNLHYNSALAGKSAVFSNSISTVVIQARHQAAHLGTGEAEGIVQVIEELSASFVSINKLCNWESWEKLVIIKSESLIDDCVTCRFIFSP